jgi:electron transfer flavoprotein beta subunit
VEILVLVKPVPEPETRIRPNTAGTWYDTEAIKWVLAGYDESAVEQALLLRESVPPSRVRALAFGPAPQTQEVLRASLALGCDAATWIERPAEQTPSPLLAAEALSVAVRKQPFDLILTGKQAGDDEAGIVGPALGELLGIPDFGPAVDIRVNASKNELTLKRAFEQGLESVAAPFPCLVVLQKAWNDPRTARLPNILKSRRAPIDRVPWTDVESSLADRARPHDQTTGFRLPPPRSGAKMIDYTTPEEAAEKLVKILSEEAKVLP